MATDWAADVKKYVANADDAAIAGIVKYCGIALRNRDSSLVSFSDKTELDRVRNNYLKKKLGLTQSDATLDKAIAKVGERMKADRTKNRVTVYYLLAEEFKKLGLFVKKPAEKAKAPAAKAPATKAPAAKAEAKAPAKKAAAPAKSAAKAAGAAAAVAGAAAAGKAAAKKTAAAKKETVAAKPAAKAAAKPAAKAAAPAKKAASPVKKAAPAKKAAAAKPQTLVDKAADVVADAGKAGTAAVAGTVAAAGAAGAAAVAAATGAADAVKDTAAKAVDAAGDAAGAVASAATGAASAAADKAGALFATNGTKATSDDDGAGLGWLWWVLGLLLLALLAWWLFGRGTPDSSAAGGAPTEAVASGEAGAAGGASDASADLASAPAEGTVEIPAGAGVTSETRDGKPVVKVYFDSGKVDVAPAFAPAAGGLKAWLAGHSGSTLAISGYADPSGNAALNAELAKKRAQAVQAELVKAGIPEASALLVKPDSVTDANVAKDAARRVEVVVK